jgi:hypothetical protein
MTVLTWILSTLASFGLSIIAFVALRSTAVGERLLDHHLARKIEDLKHEHETKIASLQSDLAHLQDRGRRANELEFDAASKVWQAFVDAYIKTQQAIVDLLSIPDLDKLSNSDLITFLEGTEFSNQQRKQVLEAGDKNKMRMFSKINRLRNINIAGASIYQGRLLLRTNGVFLPPKLSAAFKHGFDTLSGAQVEQHVNFQHRSSGGVGDYKSIDLVSAGGEALFASLETLVRSTLRRD